MRCVLLDLLLSLIGGYALIGAVVAVGFAFRGINRVDPVAAQAPLVFRLMILPGSAGLWPFVLVKWLRAGPAPQASAGDTP